MRFPAPLVLLCTALLVGAAGTPPPASSVPDPEAAQAEKTTPPVATDYTTRMSEPALVPEYEPDTAPPAYAAPAGDPGGLRQCVGADGVPIFTDRRCEDLQATPKLLPPGNEGALQAGPIRVRSCARNQDDLLAGVRAALESHDANHLADFYHWTGMGTVEGYRLMERLDAFSARPVVDVQLVRNALPSEVDSYGEPYFEAERLPMPPVEAAAPGEEAALPPRRPRLAWLLRVDQMRSDRDVAATVTYFHLLTNAGCWWMRF